MSRVSSNDTESVQDAAVATSDTAGDGRRRGAAAREGVGGAVLVKRQRLLDAPKRRLLLAYAPAGYGKSVLLRQLWDAAAADQALAPWLTLARAHRSFDCFLQDISAALGRAGIQAPEWCGCPEECGSRLALLLSREDREVRLALDNYQAASCAQVDAFVKTLVLELDARARIFLATRERANIGVAALAARGEVTVLDAGALKFTPDETIELLRSRAGPSEAAALADAVEGWPAALALSRAFAVWRTENPRCKANYLERERAVAAYLVEETFEPLPCDLRSFLIETALLDHLDAHAADEVRSRDDSAALLEQLRRSGALVFSSPDAPRRLSRHRLLSAFLQSRFTLLPEDRRAEIAKRAAALTVRRGGALRGLALQRRFLPEDAGATLLADEPFEVLWGWETICGAGRRFKGLSKHDAPSEPLLAWLHAVARYRGGAVKEARPGMDAACAAVAHRPTDDRGACTLGRAMIAALFDEAATDDFVAEIEDLARRHENRPSGALPAHLSDVLVVRAGRRARASLERTARVDEHTAFATLQAAMTSLFDGDLQKAQAHLMQVSALHFDDQARDVLTLCEVWLRYESGRAWDESELPPLSETPMFLGFSPDLLGVRARLGVWSAGRRSGFDGAFGAWKAARRIADMHGWRRAGMSVDAGLITYALSAGVRNRQTDRIAEELSPWSEPEAALALASHDLLRRAHAAARRRLAPLASSVSIARRWRARACVLAAKAAHAAGDVSEANAALGEFLVLCAADPLPASFFEGGADLWETLLALVGRAGQDEEGATRLRTVAALAVSRPVMMGSEELEGPSDFEVRMFAALKRGGSRAQAARALKLTENGLKYHLKKVNEKWGVSEWRLAAQVAEALNAIAPDCAPTAGRKRR